MSADLSSDGIKIGRGVGVGVGVGEAMHGSHSLFPCVEQQDGRGQ